MEDFFKKVILELTFEGNEKGVAGLLGNSFLCRKNNQYKDMEVEQCLVCLKQLVGIECNRENLVLVEVSLILQGFVDYYKVIVFCFEGIENYWKVLNR